MTSRPNRRSGEAPRRVLVFSPDLLPYPGVPTVGSALRAWGLGRGLEAAGHEVIFSMPQVAIDALDLHLDPEVHRHAWARLRMDEVIEDVDPDVAVVCGWSTMKNLSLQTQRRRPPVILDQHGPHLLERAYQEYGNSRVNEIEKVRTLRACDYFTCAGERQLAYFQFWLERAGWSTADRDERAAAVIFSMSPDLPDHHASDNLTFVFSGVWLPWQDPTVGLARLVTHLERRQTGKLEIFGGRHPWIDISPGVANDLVERLRLSSRVSYVGQLSHDDLLARYSHASVAMDLMAKNRERELAVTSRTVEYLWSGIPVIYNDYSELSPLIQEYDAGWIVAPTDEAGIDAILEEIFDNPGLVHRKSANARRLVSERLAWDVTMSDLDRIVRGATLREGSVPLSPSPLSLAGRVTWMAKEFGAQTMLHHAVRRSTAAARRLVGRRPGKRVREGAPDAGS